MSIFSAFMLLFTGLFIAWLFVLLFKVHLAEQRRQEKRREEEKIRREKDEEQERIKAELEKLKSDIIGDWVRNPNRDKARNRPGGGIIYAMDNGNVIESNYEKTLIVNDGRSTTTYGLGLLTQMEFAVLFMKIVNDINNGRAKSDDSRTYNGRHYSKKDYESDPKRRRLATIRETITLRKASLAGMNSSHPDWEILTNELRAAERKAAQLEKELN